MSPIQDLLWASGCFFTLAIILAVAKVWVNTKYWSLTKTKKTKKYMFSF